MIRAGVEPNDGLPPRSDLRPFRDDFLNLPYGAEHLPRDEFSIDGAGEVDKLGFVFLSEHRVRHLRSLTGEELWGDIWVRTLGRFGVPRRVASHAIQRGTIEFVVDPIIRTWRGRKEGYRVPGQGGPNDIPVVLGEFADFIDPEGINALSPSLVRIFQGLEVDERPILEPQILELGVVILDPFDGENLLKRRDDVAVQLWIRRGTSPDDLVGEGGFLNGCDHPTQSFPKPPPGDHGQPVIDPKSLPRTGRTGHLFGIVCLVCLGTEAAPPEPARVEKFLLMLLIENRFTGKWEPFGHYDRARRKPSRAGWDFFLRFLLGERFHPSVA
mgnify:CR=1 FL=1